jgi:hypothetical protein
VLVNPPKTMIKILFCYPKKYLEERYMFVAKPSDEIVLHKTFSYRGDFYEIVSELNKSNVTYTINVPAEEIFWARKIS